MSGSDKSEVRLLHLSDLHLEPANAVEILKALVRALAAMELGRVDACLVTGDLFDSGDLDRSVASGLLSRLLDVLGAVVGASTPVVLLPGNHDRRKLGLFGRNKAALFDELRAGAPMHAVVCGDPRSLVDRIPGDRLGIPLDLYAYDSTFLPPKGLIGAGGQVRSEDLLWIGSQATSPEWPIVILMHHHLVPTPVTDLDQVDSRGHWYYGAAVAAARCIVANGDREEIFMTALGAGTALSAMHALGRPVLVLHGHKHYPTARVLGGIRQGEGDLLLLSAGSAGLGAPISEVGPKARTWPSLNLLTLGTGEAGGRLHAETLAFSPRRAAFNGRPLADADWRGSGWVVHPVAHGAVGTPEVNRNEAQYSLVPGADATELDLVCARTFDGNGKRSSHKDWIQGLKGGCLDVGGTTRALPCSHEVPTGKTTYTIHGAIAATLERLRASHETSEAFEWVGLHNSYDAGAAVLGLTGLLPTARAFGSCTDLTTGRQEPRTLEPAGPGAWQLQVAPCPAHTLLRIHWPVEAVDAKPE